MTLRQRHGIHWADADCKHSCFNQVENRFRQVCHHLQLREEALEQAQSGTALGPHRARELHTCKTDCLYNAAQADEDGWDIYWASVITIKQIFSPENSVRLEPHQIINHFPNHYELTRKVTHTAVDLQTA